MTQPWHLSNRFDPDALPLADRHYNRRKIGSPQFVPPGRCLVLITGCRRALWVTSYPFAEYVRHAWAGAWVCSLFRNEGAGPGIDLIRAALAATCATWEPPPLGMVTFINPGKVEPKRVRGAKVWGWTWLRAGFRAVGETAGGLLAFQILPADMPAPEAAMTPLGRLL